MTYNQTINLFEDIATAHKAINSFGHGEDWEIEGEIKPGYKYPLFWAMPIDSETQEQVKVRTFRLFVFEQVMKDKSNEKQILSSCETILDEVIKILKNESPDYEVQGNPLLIPFKEDFGDWCAGWYADVQIMTDFNSMDCDVPKNDL